MALKEVLLIICISIPLVGIAVLWIKMGFIWRDTMLDQLKRWEKDMQRLDELKNG